MVVLGVSSAGHQASTDTRKRGLMTTQLRGVQFMTCRALVYSGPGQTAMARQTLAVGFSLLYLVRTFIGKSSGVCKTKWLETGGADALRTLRHFVIEGKIL